MVSDEVSKESVGTTEVQRLPVTPARQLRLKLLLLLGSVMATFLAGELALRVMGAKPMTATVLTTYFCYSDNTGWVGRPNAAAQFATTNFDVHITHDADGLRQCGLTSSIRDDANRKEEVVWCLGDSGTWGWGVEDGATYVDRLNQMSSGGRIYRNLGQCGFSSVQEYLLLKRYFEQGQKPNLVLIFFCGNDLDENMDGEDQSPPRAYYKVENGQPVLCNYPVPLPRAWNIQAWFKTRSLAFNYLDFYANRAKLHLHERKHPTVNTTGTSPAKTEVEPEKLIVFREVYSSISELCKRHGVGFAMVGLNDSEVVSPICRDLNVPILDVSKRWNQHLASGENPTPLRFPTDPHFNELGHRLIAEAIHEDLCELRVAGNGRDLVRR